MANYVLREDFEKFLEKISITHLRKLSMQGAITWQKEYISKEMKKRQLKGENLTEQFIGNESNISASDQLTKLLATQTWY